MSSWERPKFSLGKSTPEQAKGAIDGYTAYFGTWSVDEQTSIITHYRAGNINPGDMGDFVREGVFNEKQLILRTRGTNNRIIWKRAGQQEIAAACLHLAYLDRSLRRRNMSGVRCKAEVGATRVR